MLSSASHDLGLGDQLKGQVEAELLKRKKKTEQMANEQAGAALGPATQSLFSSPGV
jgi:hypothetical protein